MTIKMISTAALVAVLGTTGAMTAAAQKLTGAGASFPNPIYSKWFSEYSASHPGVQINYQSVGSGAGIRQVSEKTVDFGASDGPMTDEQLAASKQKLVHIPTVMGAVVPVYNIPGRGPRTALFAGCDRRHLSRQDHEVERSAHRKGQPRPLHA